MLGKLLKYDIKALSRVLVPVHLVVAVIGILTCACLYGGYVTGELPYGTTALPSSRSFDYDSLSTLLYLIGIFGMFTLFAATLTTFIIIMYRFYRNLFTDEGYLTLTLPATANQQILSKILSAAFWLIIDGAVVALLLHVSFLAGDGFTSVTDEGALPLLLSVASGISVDTAFEYGFAYIVVFAQALAGVLTAYAGFALGSNLAKRHKVAAGIGIYIGFSWIAGIFHIVKSTLIGFVFLDTSWYGSSSLGATTQASQMISMGSSLVIYLITCIVFYAVCVYVLERRANLA